MSLNVKSFLTLVLFALQAHFTSIANAQTYVPEELQPWQEWVLKDKEYRQCPFYFDQTVEQASAFVCSWPGTLELDVDASGARFTQQWTVYTSDQWVTSLPTTGRSRSSREIMCRASGWHRAHGASPGVSNGRIAPECLQFRSRLHWFR